MLGSKAIGADWRFVSEELQIASNPVLSLNNRLPAGILGFGLGLCSLPKTLLKLGTPTGYSEIMMWYQVSNFGVNNMPSIHNH